MSDIYVEVVNRNNFLFASIFLIPNEKKKLREREREREASPSDLLLC